MEQAKVKSRSRNKLLAAILILAAFAAGYVTRSISSRPAGAGAQETTAQKWTCSMHPQIIRDKPGKCPICFMDLVPLSGHSAASVSAPQLVISEEATKLMEIETSAVERKFVTAQIRMVGKIDYDETKLKDVTAWVPGRIDRLFVDFTGIRVNKGDHMVKLYSPQLISAQAELQQAVKASQNIGADTSALLRNSTLATLEASREKLRLLGLTTEQIQNIESSGKEQTHITITAPIGGIVIDKKASEGMYVTTGAHLYTVADLSSLWAKLDAYESDLVWIRYGQEVEFTTEAYPGETFRGTISFIDPVLNPKTRTVKLRVNIDNPQEKLKPNMFVRAVVRSKIAEGGKVMSAAMAGKWICPMHPEIVKDSKGTCDICGMNLVTTESLGYVAAKEPTEPPLVIPASAPLITGKHAIVYVQAPDSNLPTFEAREIVLGSRAADYYLVESGLDEGERVVTKGNFKIDSEMQIRAKPSMMNTSGGPPPAHHHEHSH